MLNVKGALEINSMYNCRTSAFIKQEVFWGLSHQIFGGLFGPAYVDRSGLEKEPLPVFKYLFCSFAFLALTYTKTFRGVHFEFKKLRENSTKFKNAY